MSMDVRRGGYCATRSLVHGQGRKIFRPYADQADKRHPNGLRPYTDQFSSRVPD